MAIISSQTIPTDGSTKNFQILGNPLSKSHIGIWIIEGEEYVWQDYDTWDMLGSVVLFKTAPILGSILINIYETSEELPSEPDVSSSYLLSTGDTMTGDLSFGDNIVANFGDSNDLQIVHNGTNGYIQNVGNGYLNIKSDTLVLSSSGSPADLYFVGGTSGSYMYHKGDTKLETTATGVTVSGTITETAYTLTGTDIDPTNGSMQYKTTTGAETITGTNFQAGQAVTLTLSAPTSVTFTGFTWVTADGSAPTILSYEDTFVLWMDGDSNKFVSYVGGRV